MFKHIGLVGKHRVPEVLETLDKLITYLQAHRVSVTVDPDNAHLLSTADIKSADLPTMGRKCDLVIIVGGDGTFLRAASTLVEYEVRLLGIHMGRVGFLTDLTPPRMCVQLDQVLAGDFTQEERFLLHTTIMREGEALSEVDALNDIVAHNANIARLIEFETYINGQLVSCQRSDGLIVSTPTGSTAYALAGGGPILHPGLDAIVLVPICPNTLSSRPIVVDGDSEIEIVIGPRSPTRAQLASDGQITLNLEPGDRILIHKKRKHLHLIHPPGHDYFATLRQKLDWNREL